MDEVLRTVPGVQIQTSGSPGKLSTVRIRGREPHPGAGADRRRAREERSPRVTSTSPTSPSTTSRGSRSCGARSRPSTARTRSAAWSTSSRSAGRGRPRASSTSRPATTRPSGSAPACRGAGALELLPRREPARLRRPVRQRRPGPHQRERAGRLRAAEQGRAVAHRAIPGRAPRHPVRHGVPGLRPEPRAGPAARAPLPRVAPALDVDLGAQPPGIGRR